MTESEKQMMARLIDKAEDYRRMAYSFARAMEVPVPGIAKVISELLLDLDKKWGECPHS